MSTLPRMSGWQMTFGSWACGRFRQSTRFSWWSMRCRRVRKTWKTVGGGISGREPECWMLTMPRPCFEETRRGCASTRCLAICATWTPYCCPATSCLPMAVETATWPSTLTSTRTIWTCSARLVYSSGLARGTLRQNLGSTGFFGTVGETTNRVISRRVHRRTTSNSGRPAVLVRSRSWRFSRTRARLDMWTRCLASTAPTATG